MYSRETYDTVRCGNTRCEQAQASENEESNSYTNGSRTAHEELCE